MSNGEPVPAILYKYLTPERFHVLTDCRVRFTQRKFFPDDHELQPDYHAYGTVDEIRRQIESVGKPLCAIPPRLLAVLIAINPKHQRKSIETAVNNIKSFDQMGILCLSVTADSEQMWNEYASQGTGFVVGFDTTHAGFRKLTAPMGVLKVSYSSEGFSTFLGMMEKTPFEPLYRKQMEYSFEQEWRSLRLLKNLELHSGEIYISQFDPACVSRIVVGPDCTLKDGLQELVATDPRYEHVPIADRRLVK